MWQAMDFEVIQGLRRRKDLAALAADGEAALVAEEGAALAADGEAEHSTNAAFSEGDGPSDDESVTESQDDEFVALRKLNEAGCTCEFVATALLVTSYSISPTIG